MISSIILFYILVLDLIIDAIKSISKIGNCLYNIILPLFNTILTIITNMVNFIIGFTISLVTLLNNVFANYTGTTFSLTLLAILCLVFHYASFYIIIPLDPNMRSFLDNAFLAYQGITIASKPLWIKIKSFFFSYYSYLTYLLKIKSYFFKLFSKKKVQHIKNKIEEKIMEEEYSRSFLHYITFILLPSIVYSIFIYYFEIAHFANKIYNLVIVLYTFIKLHYYKILKLIELYTPKINSSINYAKQLYEQSIFNPVTEDKTDYFFRFYTSPLAGLILSINLWNYKNKSPFLFIIYCFISTLYVILNRLSGIIWNKPLFIILHISILLNLSHRIIIAIIEQMKLSIIYLFDMFIGKIKEQIKTLYKFTWYIPIWYLIRPYIKDILNDSTQDRRADIRQIRRIINPARINPMNNSASRIQTGFIHNIQQQLTSEQVNEAILQLNENNRNISDSDRLHLTMGLALYRDINFNRVLAIKNLTELYNTVLVNVRNRSKLSLSNEWLRLYITRDLNPGLFYPVGNEGWGMYGRFLSDTLTISELKRLLLGIGEMLIVVMQNRPINIQLRAIGVPIQENQVQNEPVIEQDQVIIPIVQRDEQFREAFRSDALNRGNLGLVNAIRPLSVSEEFILSLKNRPNCPDNNITELFGKKQAGWFSDEYYYFKNKLVFQPSKMSDILRNAIIPASKPSEHHRNGRTHDTIFTEKVLQLIKKHKLTEGQIDCFLRFNDGKYKERYINRTILAYILKYQHLNDRQINILLDNMKKTAKYEYDTNERNVPALERDNLGLDLAVAKLCAVFMINPLYKRNLLCSKDNLFQRMGILSKRIENIDKLLNVLLLQSLDILLEKDSEVIEQGYREWYESTYAVIT